jgi:hypothetical protein
MKVVSRLIFLRNVGAYDQSDKTAPLWFPASEASFPRNPRKKEAITGYDLFGVDVIKIKIKSKRTGQPKTTTTTTTTATTTTTSNTHKMISPTETSTTSNNNLSGSTFQLLNVPTKLNNINSLIRVPHRKPETMLDGYIPSDSDVCCGRGKQNWTMTGNVNFRKLIRASVDRYMAAPLKNDKTAVVVSVVYEIRRQGGHFFRQKQHGSSGRWYDIGDAAARDKVGHSLRDQAGASASAAKSLQSLLQQAKEHTSRAAAEAARVCDSVDSAGASLAETSSLPSLSLSPSPSPSSSSSSCAEELVVDCFIPVTTTFSRHPSCLVLAPIDISSVMGGTDQLPTDSSQLLLSDFLIGCFDI